VRSRLPFFLKQREGSRAGKGSKWGDADEVWEPGVSSGKKKKKNEIVERGPELRRRKYKDLARHRRSRYLGIKRGRGIFKKFVGRKRRLWSLRAARRDKETQRPDGDNRSVRAEPSGHPRRGCRKESRRKVRHKNLMVSGARGKRLTNAVIPPKTKAAHSRSLVHGQRRRNKVLGRRPPQRGTTSRPTVKGPGKKNIERSNLLKQPGQETGRGKRGREKGPQDPLCKHQVSYSKERERRTERRGHHRCLAHMGAEVGGVIMAWHRRGRVQYSSKSLYSRKTWSVALTVQKSRG